MRLILITAITGLMASPKSALADGANENPYPWMATSAEGQFLFKMVPPSWRKSGGEPVIDRPPFGVAYSLTDDGEFKELWRADGWYGYRGKLSDDGRYLVVFGPWASDQKEHKDLAIAFYDKGKLLKQYAVRDLIREHDAVEESVSHYMWTPERQTKPNGFYEDRFHLVTIEKTVYDFDYTTGEISSRTRDEGAKSIGETLAEEEAERRSRGQKLLDTNSFKGDFQQHFEILDVSASSLRDMNSILEGLSWKARLVPKQKFDHKVSVSVDFPIKEDRLVDVSLTPRQMITAIEKALKHPFVKQQLEIQDSSGITLYTLGDRLHWNTPEFLDFYGKTKDRNPESVAQWAYFGINDGRDFHSSIYLDTDTNDIIVEDPSTWPITAYLINSKGERQPPPTGASPGKGKLHDPE